MDFLLAKVKRSQNPSHFKVISDRKVYSFDLSDYSPVDYAPDYLLEDDEIYRVSEFSKKDFFLSILNDGRESADYNQIPLSKYKSISYLCSVQDGVYCFQKVTPSMYVNRSILRLGENSTIENSENKIFINPVPDAFYVKDDDELLFRNLATISSIFKGIDSLYKEATQEEVEVFLSEQFISVVGDYNAGRVSKPNRKRIALAMESLGSLAESDRGRMLDYIHAYCEQIAYDSEGKIFTISNDDELKFLLFGIEQRFYTTMLGDEKRLANSVLTLS